MAGFVESFNVSVSAALAVYDVASRRREIVGSTGDLEGEALLARAAQLFEKALKVRGKRITDLRPLT